MNLHAAQSKTSNLPSIHPWKGVFVDPEQERTYKRFQWPQALVRYKLMAVFGFLMSFGDPTVYTRGTTASYLEAVTNTTFFALPFLFRNYSRFQKHHDRYSGMMLLVMLGLSMVVGIPSMEEHPLLNPAIFSIFPITVFIVTYCLFPLGMVMSSVIVICMQVSHIILGLVYMKELTDQPYVESFLFPCTVFGIIIMIMLFFYHREMEVGRRLRFAQLNSLEEKREYIENTFKAYMGGTVADTILTESTSLQGEDRWVTILFTDLKGYSTIIEPMSPKEVLSMINDYFAEMADIIEEHDGVVLEYIGDAMMIVFGAPEEVEHHQYKAVQCAMKMREHMVVLNERWKKEGLARYWINQDIPELTARAGIHTGHIVAGNIGSRKKMKYGAIGDVVNIAARLEQLNKQMNTDILFSRPVYVSLPLEVVPNVKDCGTVSLKGREQEEKVYSI